MFGGLFSSNHMNLGKEQKADSIQKNNKKFTSSSNFVNYNGGDFRVKKSASLCDEMMDETFDMTSIGIQKAYEISDMSFDLM